MHGMRRLEFVLGSTALFLALSVLGCSKPANTEGTTITTSSSEETKPRSSGPSRGEVACRLHSCSPPYFCNEDKGICERLPCVESRDCPYDYKCDFSLHVCQ
jgi:hypothetical protein